MSVKDLLVEARFLIAMSGWCQSQDDLSLASSVPFTALGAIGVADLMRWAKVTREQRRLDYLGAIDAIAVLMPPPPLATVFSPADAIVAWNDAPGRTQTEVLDVFELAIRVEGLVDRVVLMSAGSE